ncbi:hypothetical protein AAVH_28718, partial [Aphelenchoides avenae]
TNQLLSNSLSAGTMESPTERCNVYEGHFPMNTFMDMINRERSLREEIVRSTAAVANSDPYALLSTSPTMPQWSMSPPTSQNPWLVSSQQRNEQDSTATAAFLQRK